MTTETVMYRGKELAIPKGWLLLTSGRIQPDDRLPWSWGGEPGWRDAYPEEIGDEIDPSDLVIRWSEA